MISELYGRILDVGERALAPVQRGNRGRVVAAGIRALATELDLPIEKVLDALEGADCKPIEKWLAKRRQGKVA